MYSINLNLANKYYIPTRNFIKWLKAQGDFICGTAHEVVLRRVQMDMKICTSKQ